MAIHTARIAAVAGLLYAARRYYRNWGTTKEECQMRLPGDDLIGRPAVQTTEGVWIDQPPEAVWPWLVQMGQDRGGLYSYQKLENLVGLDHHNADRIHPEWQQLAPGDVIRLVPKGWLGLRDGIALPVVEVLDRRTIVLRGSPPELPWDGVWSFHVFPRGDDRSRLLVRLRARLHYPGEVLAAELAGPITAVMTRGMLRGIKRRAERMPNAAKSGRTAADEDGRR